MASFEDFYKAIKQIIDEDQEATDEQRAALFKGVEGAKPFIDILYQQDEELGLTKEEHYILNYLAEHRPEEGQPKTAYEETVIQLVSMMFINSHRDTVQALYDPEERKALVNSITNKDLEEINLSRKDERVKALLKSKEPELDDILDVIGFGNALHIYEKHNKYRTKAKAEKAGAITEMPANLIIPTLKGYQYSMSLHKEGGSYLQPLRSMDGLRFKDGKLYFDGARMQEVSEAELRDLRTKEGIKELDLMALRFYYSILFNQFQLSNYKALLDVVPVSASILTGRNDPNENEVNAAIAKVQSFHNVMGVVKGTRNNRPTESYYQVLNFEYYDENKNIIAFSSPYMNYVISTIYKLAIRRSQGGKPKLKANGLPLTKPHQSFMIDSSIAKERNKAAAENVVLLVTLIEQSGGNLPNLKASTLIERNVQFAERLESDPQHKAQLLKRVFTKTWELMQTKTSLAQRYKNLRVSVEKNSNGVLLTELNPKDPAFIPTVKNLKDLCFYFPHDGKVEEKEQA